MPFIRAYATRSAGKTIINRWSGVRTTSSSMWVLSRIQTSG